jgi:ATP-dependent Clp protease ATP-binding subunit ClpA
MPWLPRLIEAEPTRSPVPFAADAERVFAAAVRSVRARGDEIVATVDLLIALVEAGPPEVLDALTQAGIDPSIIRARCEAYLHHGPALGRPSDPLMLTSWVKRVLSASWAQAQQDGAPGVGAVGLLLALSREQGGIGNELLGRLVGG